MHKHKQQTPKRIHQPPSSLQQALTTYNKSTNKPKPPKQIKTNLNNTITTINPYQNPITNTNINRISRNRNRRKSTGNYRIIRADGGDGDIGGMVEVGVGGGECWDDGRKRALEVAYVKVVQQLFPMFVNQCTHVPKLGPLCEYVQNVTIPQTVLYFLGSLNQRIKKHPTQISYLQFLDECIKIFQRSSYNDIQQFLTQAANINNNNNNNTTARKQTDIKREQILVVEVEEKQDKDKDKDKKEVVSVSFEVEKDVDEGRLKKEESHKQDIKIVESVKRTPKRVKFEDQIPHVQVKENTNYRQVQQLRKLPITSTVQSKILQQTPRVCQTLKSEVSSPIHKIVNPNPNHNNPTIQIAQNPPICSQTTTILSKISTNLDKLSKTLCLPTPSPKPTHLPRSPFSSIENICKIQLLQEKYGKINRNCMGDLAKGKEKGIEKEKENRVSVFEDGDYRSSVEIGEVRVGGEGKERGKDRDRSVYKCERAEEDKIDRLTAKVQEYINKNSTRIQTNMRNLSRLRKQ